METVGGLSNLIEEEEAMSYHDAKQCFQENRELINPQSDPQVWNLNTGLLSLTEAIESDFQNIAYLLQRILRVLQQ